MVRNGGGVGAAACRRRCLTTCFKEVITLCFLFCYCRGGFSIRLFSIGDGVRIATRCGRCLTACPKEIIFLMLRIAVANSPNWLCPAFAYGLTLKGSLGIEYLFE